MKYKKMTLTALFLLCLGLAVVNAQDLHDAILPSGGDASGSGGSVSYSVGQVVYTLDSSASGSVAKGVQQPYEISEIVGIEEAKGIDLEIIAFPNPTTDLLRLKVENHNVGKLSYQLYDLNGNLLESKRLTGMETSIPVKNLASAAYFLKVTDNQKVLKTFKIIKN